MSVLDDDMVIADAPFWDEMRREWSYPIVGRANPTEEHFLMKFNGDNETGTIIY